MKIKIQKYHGVSNFEIEPRSILAELEVLNGIVDGSLNTIAMNSNLTNIFKLLPLEYIILDRKAIVIDFSDSAQKNTQLSKKIEISKLFNFEFLEEDLIEEIIEDIFQGERDQYKFFNIQLKPEFSKKPRYFNLYFSPYSATDVSDTHILVVLEDSTSKMVLEKQVVQKTNEVSLLAMAWSTSQAYLDKIINSMAEALIVTNASGIVKKLNPATQEMFGYHESELVDREISLVLPEKVKFPLFDARLNSSNSDNFEGDRNLEVSCLTKSGDEIVVEFSCAEIPTDLDASPDFVCIGKDITNRVKAEAKLRQALEKEKEINELKSRFVAMTSHELRTPLNTILFASELLRDTSEEDTEELLEAIEFNIKRLTELVDYVSIVGKTELETVELKKTQFDVVEFCRSLTYEIQLSQGKDSVLKFTSKTKKINVSIDRKILRHTLKSLLSNVVKYSAKKGTVSLKLSQVENNIIFVVETPKTALPIGDRQKLLESCYSSGSLSEIPETGLGFAIAQKYARLQGGRIEVEDRSGGRTIFKVTIPAGNTTGLP